jgi:hypothetical protein
VVASGIGRAQVPAPYISDVQPLDADAYHGLFGDARLKDDAVDLQFTAKDPGYKIQRGTATPAPLAAATELALTRGTEWHVFDEDTYVKFLPFPAKAPRNYLFLVEVSDPHGVTRVALLISRSGVVEEVPINIDCVRCLHKMEDRVADGSYRYEGR